MMTPQPFCTQDFSILLLVLIPGLCHHLVKKEPQHSSTLHVSNFFDFSYLPSLDILELFQISLFPAKTLPPFLEVMGLTPMESYKLLPQQRTTGGVPRGSPRLGHVAPLNFPTKMTRVEM
jgi:hypothetical protein